MSEDNFWFENGWGSGVRSPEQETTVQRQVVDSTLEHCWSGRTVVLEFILAERRCSVEHQLRVVTSEALRVYRMIDTSHLSVEKVSELVCSGLASGVPDEVETPSEAFPWADP